MNRKRRILTTAAVAVGVLAGVSLLGAFEAHIINVTAHIENALAVDAYGIDFGTVFPQEDLEEEFTIRLSDSFMDESQTRVRDVEYKIVQKPKHWRDDFDGTHPEHRELNWVDPDDNGSYWYSNDRLYIETGDDVEDLFGPNETPGDWTAPRKVMLMGGNFVAETHVYADPDNFYESAGLLAYGQDGDLVRLEFTSWSWYGDAVYMESQEGEVKTGKGWAKLSNYGQTTDVYLRLSREGDTFKGEYSTDGTTWNVVPLTFGDMDNDLAGKPALVGVAVVNSNEASVNDPNVSYTKFSASFDYVDMNGKYQDFCRFLSKLPVSIETGDQGVESYYTPNDECVAPTPDVAYGRLEKCLDPACGTADEEDCWIVDLKVPPVAGYVGQDWPESCRQDWVVPQEDDYGCDLWIEVTGFSYFSE